MIEGCIDRMIRSASDGCARRNARTFPFADSFGPQARPRGAARPKTWPRPAQTHRLLDLLGQLARAIEKGSRARSDRGRDGEGCGKARAEGFRRKVELHVEPLLPLGAVRMEKVARALRCSRQTLYRRLKGEGTTFEQLLDDLRRRLALRLVGQPGL
jgi:AraC-like DNA-binding protein